MSIAFECSGCAKKMAAGDDAAGRKAKCKACGVITHVPRLLVWETGEPREHHFDFAHRVLPHMSFGGDGNPMSVATLLSMAYDPAGARKGWDDVGSVLPKKARLPADGLAATLVEPLTNVRLVVVQMPRARRAVEALFVAGCYDARGWDGKGFNFRYLTLELSWDLAARAPRTILGEWTASKVALSHRDHGAGPPDSREAFVAACLRLLG